MKEKVEPFSQPISEQKKKMKEVLKQRQKWCGIGQSRRLGDLTVLIKALCEVDAGHVSKFSHSPIIICAIIDDSQSM